MDARPKRKYTKRRARSGEQSASSASAGSVPLNSTPASSAKPDNSGSGVNRQEGIDGYASAASRERPAASATREQATATIQEAPLKKPRRRKGKYNADEALNQAVNIVSLIESFAVSRLGNEAAMDDLERTAMTFGLAQGFEHASPKAVEGMMNLLWPAALLIGTGAYAFRLWNVASAIEPPPPSRNGREPQTPPSISPTHETSLREDIRGSKRPV